MQANVLLVEWALWSEVAAIPDGAERREALLSLGADLDPFQAGYKATKTLETFARARTVTRPTYEPLDDSERPILAYREGDTLTAPTPDGTTAELPVRSITIEDGDKTGHATVTIVVGDEGVFDE